MKIKGGYINMGFYGNITNTSNTTFSFDRIYPNRLAMDANANNDGIFIGRYVLVEYEQSAAYPNIYINNGKYYSSPNFEEATRIKYKSGGRPASDTSNDVFYLGEFGQKQESEKIYFYMCDGYEAVEENLYATFKQVTAVNKDDATPYLINHNIDYEEYKNAKGYDSSVWTKVNEEKDGKLVTRYRNIADLNSIVPTFDLETDAPTMTPITPHFDADSTNVYYKLHTQPQWGLRVAAQEDENSDSTTTWQFTTYNPATDETITHEEKNKAAAINFNGPAFDAQVGKANILKHDSGENYITILPTGESGKKYYTHTNKNGEKVYEKAPDIQEMRVNLPAIGNMMSDAWDIIHGPNRDDDMRETDEDENRVDSLQGRLNSIAAIEKNQIPIKRINNGQLVGTKINGDKHSTIADNFDASIIEDDFTQDDAWIKTQVNADNTPNAISIHHAFNKTPNSSSAWDKNEDPTWNEVPDDTFQNYKSDYLKDKVNRNNTEFDDLLFYVPYVDATGHIVGYNRERVQLPFGYKTIKVNNTLDTVVSNAAQGVKSQGQIADNTQDTLILSASNRWIKLDNNTEDTIKFGHQVNPIEKKDKDLTDLNDGTDTITIQDTIYDEAGHVTANQKHTYTLPYGYKVIKTLNSEGVGQADIDLGTNYKIVANKTQDEMQFEAANKWIGIMATEEGNVDKIYLGHLTNGNGFGKTYYAKDSNLSNDDVHKQIPNFGDNVKILNVTVDNAGHVTGFNANTITIPQGSYTPANNAEKHTDIITSIGFTPSTGAIISTKATTGTLTLSNYSANNGNLNILYTDTINEGFEKIQNHINGLDMESTSTTEFITEITQTDGQVAVKRAAAGTLQLGTASTDGTIPATSSLNDAFNITNARIKAEEDALAKEISDRNLAISSAISAIVDKDDDGTINKLAEVIDWINNNPSTATQMQTAIQNNTKAIENEKTRAENIEAGLQEQIDALGSASDYATADQGALAETAIQKGTEFNYGEEQKTIQDLMNIVKAQANTIINLSARIEALENPITTE